MKSWWLVGFYFALLAAALGGWSLYILHPRIVLVDNPIPGPAPSAPDSVIEILNANCVRLKMETMAGARTIDRLRRELAAAEDRPAEVVLEARADTAVGLKLYRSEKTFIHPTLHFGLIESHIEATAPAAVNSFMNTVRFLEGEDQVYSRIGMAWSKQHPCPPGHFWTGFGYGGMTGVGLALLSVLLIGGIR